MNAAALAASTPSFSLAPTTQATADRFLDRPEGRIAYTDAGNGPLVVMIPGLGDLKEEYRFLARQLVQGGYRAVTLDLRGHGNSSTSWPDFTCAALGSDIVALLRHLNAGAATLIGTSMGAGAAAWAAAAAPTDVANLVLIGPFVRDVPASASWLKDKALKALIRVAFVGPWAVPAWGAYYTSLYPTAKPADFDTYLARLKASLAQPGRMAAVRAMMNASKADVAGRLSEIGARALVVMGSKDPDFTDPKAEAATVASLVGGARVTMIEGAGHYPHAEMPEITAPAILEFLAQAA